MYYHLAIIGANLAPLIYHSSQPLCRGDIVECRLKNTRQRAVVLSSAPKPDFQTSQCGEKIASLSALQVELMLFISRYYVAHIGMAAALFAYQSANEAKRTLAVFTQSQNLPLASLNAQQLCALEEIFLSNTTPKSQLLPACVKPQQNTATPKSQPNFFLLFGDTGSGKTELYIHAIERTLLSGRQVLFLMPEISLTPQMCARISKHFNHAIWHSKINKSAKEQVILALNERRINLVLGARSALFLPWSDLGLIIVDEEHDLSYKSARHPCINARDLALFAAKSCGARVILGSATPSMSSFYNSALRQIRLRGTYFKSEKEVIFHHSSELLCDELIEQIISAKRAQRTSLLFLPLRANFRQVVCKECAHVAMCPRCSVALSLHGKVFKCHYCGFRMRLYQNCPNCKSSELEGRKIGTAQLEIELAAKLKEQDGKRHYKIARLDSDEASSASKLKSILKALEGGEIDVIIGTQMIAKGHDYHNIAFVGILGLDSQLFYPEYSARENTLALAIQVAGRAGRSGRAKVMICTQHKDFFAKYLQDYEQFLRDEASLREFYPPFKRLLRLLIESHDEGWAQRLCANIASQLSAQADCQLLGYGPCAIEKIGNKYRYNVLVRSDKKLLLSQIAAQFLSLPKVTIDIDPVNFS